MKGTAFFDLAERLFAADKSPEALRNAIGRAYYGALHRGIEFLKDAGVTIPKKSNEHEKIPDLLGHSGVDDLETVGKMLETLRRQRNDADYHLEKTDPEDESFVALRLSDARRIIAILNSCLLGKGNPESKFEKARTPIRERADILFLGK